MPKLTPTRLIVLAHLAKHGTTFEREATSSMTARAMVLDGLIKRFPGVSTRAPNYTVSYQRWFVLRTGHRMQLLPLHQSQAPRS